MEFGRRGESARGAPPLFAFLRALCESHSRESGNGLESFDELSAITVPPTRYLFMLYGKFAGLLWQG